MVYIGSYDGSVYKLRVEDGKVVWKFNLDAVPYPPEAALNPPSRRGTQCSPTVAEGKVFIHGNKPGAIAIDAETSELIWQNPTYRYRGWVSIEIPNPPGGWAYRDGKLWYMDQAFMMCVDAKTGEVIWPDLWLEPDPADFPVTGVYEHMFASDNYVVNVYGDHVDFGGWAEPKDLNYGFVQQDQYAGCSVAGTQVYTAGSSAGASVYSFDAETGLKTGWYCTGRYITSSPSIAYGNLYIGDDNFNVYCFSEGQPRMLGWPSPDRAESSITAELSSAAAEIRVGDWVAFEGAVTPMPIQHGRSMVIVRFINPDGWALEVNGMTNTEDGKYRITYHPDMEGTYTATAFWYGDDFSKGAESAEITFTVLGPPAPPAPPAPAAVFSIEYYYVVIVVVTIAVLSVAAYWYIRR
jgi:outer membrane protein assembly factor BamB